VRSVYINEAVSCQDYVLSVAGEGNMSRDHWWIDSDRDKSKY